MMRKHPLAPISVAYKRAVVRACAEALREIEGRLCHPCGARWESQLQGCDDLGTVARLILALQRRSNLPSPDSAWLDEMAALKPEEIDRRAVELTLRIKHRLAELAVAVPHAVEPRSLIGAPVLRHYEGAGAFPGVVVEYEELVGFRVKYSDGEFEDVPLRELQSMLLRQGIGQGRAIARTTDPVGAYEREGQGDGVAQTNGEVSGEPLAPGYEAYVNDATLDFVYQRMVQQQRADGFGDEASEGARIDVSQGGEPAAPQTSSSQLPKRGQGRQTKSPAGTNASQPKPSKAPSGALNGSNGMQSAGRGGTGAASKEPAPAAGEKRKGNSGEDGLPPGWTVEGSGSRRTVRAPDGFTNVTSMAQVRRWQRAQLSLVAQYERVSEKKRIKDAPPPPKPDYGDLGVRSSTVSDEWLAVPQASQRQTVARPQLPTAGMSVEDAAAAAAAMTGKSGKGVSRELRMLAMPDRDWNVAIPYYSLASKTRDQFQASMQAEGTDPSPGRL